MLQEFFFKRPLKTSNRDNTSEFYEKSSKPLRLLGHTHVLITNIKRECKDHVTNEEVRTKIQQAIGSHENLLTIVKRHKLQWYGHVSRSSGLAKTVLQGTVKEGRRQGRQRKRWEDNIREWTGLEFG